MFFFFSHIAEAVGAGSRFVGGRLGRVELRSRLLVAELAGRALHPVEVAAGVDNHLELLRRRAQGERHEVLAVASRHGALELHVLRPVVQQGFGAQFVRQIGDPLVAASHRLHEPLLHRLAVEIRGAVQLVPVHELHLHRLQNGAGASKQARPAAHIFHQNADVVNVLEISKGKGLNRRSSDPSTRDRSKCSKEA